jgi:glycosyltransferase involved in cell wall biosynthesis
VDATILIVTRNRKHELRRALESCLGQEGDFEILVIDDGSDDGSPDMVASLFPMVRLVRGGLAQGCVPRRNEGVRLARGRLIVTIDDDLVLVGPTTVLDTLREFTDERIGAVAIPFRDIRGDVVSPVIQRAPDCSRVWVAHMFRGGAHALRRDVFLEVGGFPEDLVFFGEELDYCVRMLDAGYVTRLGSAEPAEHRPPPELTGHQRRRRAAQGVVSFAINNVPTPVFVPHLFAATCRELVYGWRHGSVGQTLQGLYDGCRCSLEAGRSRRPVNLRTYRLLWRLRSAGALSLDEIARDLPSLRPVAREPVGSAWGRT